MKNLIKRGVAFGVFFICLLGLSVLGVNAASNSGISVTQSGSTQTFSTLAQAVDYYKQSNPSAAQHTIAAGHRVVYDKDSSFKDNVNATTSVFSYYAKQGAFDLTGYTLNSNGTTSSNGFYVLKNLGITAISDDTAASGREILVGLVDRNAQSSFLSMVDVNEYGIMVTDTAIILLAWQDAALKVCVDVFKAYLNSGQLSLPIGFIGIGVADTAWKTDFDRPANTVLAAAQEVNDNSLQLVYTGTGATNAGYLAYCQKLEEKGFVLLWQSTVGSNEFRMYRNTSKDIALYVAYNDYTYQKEFDELYRANYTAATNAYLPGAFEACIRIVSSPISSVTLPDHKLNSRQPYTKVTDTYMVTLGLAGGNVGSAHVIMLEDGRFVIIDGGEDKVSGVSTAQNLWNVMLKLYERAYGAGAVPTAQRPIHVAAWYLTHAHADHYNAVVKMINMIASDASRMAVFRMDYMIANLPGNYSLFNNTSTKWGYQNNSNVKALQSKIGFQFIKVHTGQRLYFANLMIEILMTFEDHLPFRINNTNDTNTVARFHIISSSAAPGTAVSNLSGHAITVMFLGDSWRAASRYLCAMYGSYLKSDISQIAHHGNIGCEKELYDQIAPTGVLFNEGLASFKKYVWGTTTSSNPEQKHAYAVDRYVVQELTSVLYIWAAVENCYPTLRFAGTGAQYEAVFDLGTGKAISYVNVSQGSNAQTGFARRSTHTHSYGAWQKYDQTQHKRVCACGAIELAGHGWNGGTVTKPATHLEAGSKVQTCTGCGESKTVSIPALVGHSYGAWQKYDQTRHKRVCACGAIELAGHGWNGGTVTKPATHLEAGSKVQTCTGCGESKTVSIPALVGHSYGAWQRYDQTQHKRVCACGDEAYAEHAWNAGTVTVQPSHLEVGAKVFACTDCGESYTEDMPKTAAHTYGEWRVTEEAALGKEGKRERSCACGETVTQVIPALEEGAAPSAPPSAGDALDTETKPPKTGVIFVGAGAIAIAFAACGLCLYGRMRRRKK